MNNKATVYTVLAVMVGYLLISTVPGQVERYMIPRPVTLTSPGDTNGERTLGKNEGSLNATEEAPMFILGEENQEVLPDEADGPLLGVDRVLVNNMDLYKWWALDLGIAFSVYWLARRRLG